MDVRVATVQIWVSRDPEQNLAKCLDRVDTACRAGAQLVLLPEFCNYSGPFEDQEHAWELASPLDGPFVRALAEKARDHGIHLAFNLLARDTRPTVYDTTVLVGPDGATIGTYEKQVLFGHETDHISVGRGGPAVFDTAVGRLGLYICMDGLIPETTRCLAVQGAQVLLNPLHSGGPDEAFLHVPARAAENHVWIVSSNNVGPMAEGHAACYAGGSSIVGPTGEVLARASETDEEIVYGTIRPEAADDKRLPGGADLLRDRRPETYRALAASPPPAAGDAAPPVRAPVAAIQTGPAGDGPGPAVTRAIALCRAPRRPARGCWCCRSYSPSAQARSPRTLLARRGSHRKRWPNSSSSPATRTCTSSSAWWRPPGTDTTARRSWSGPMASSAATGRRTCGRPTAPGRPRATTTPCSRRHSAASG
jgi:deaminated glutathione amidase